MNQANIQSTTQETERPSFEEWCRMFNVSSRYVPRTESVNSFQFDMDKFKKNLSKKDLTLSN